MNSSDPPLDETKKPIDETKKREFLESLSLFQENATRDDERWIEEIAPHISDREIQDADRASDVIQSLRESVGAGRFIHETELQQTLRATKTLVDKQADHDESDEDKSDRDKSDQDKTDHGTIASSPPSESTELRPGVKIGEFQILAFIGGGGMGAVYKALQPGLDRHVAVKVIRQESLHSQEVSRFEQEMKAVGRLNHPNIVRALHAGNSQFGPFLAMEIVDGQSLSQRLKENGRLDVLQACEIVRQIALGLEHAHHAGIIHRDIKPSNVMLASDRTIKILDLGLARCEVSNGEGLTHEGQYMGTADYIAPEQAMDATKCDARADLYSLGCTFFELLVGATPFSSPQQRTVASKIAAHLNLRAPSARVLRPDVPKSVSRIVWRLMRKKPSHRFQSARALIEALDRAIEELKNASEPKVGENANRVQNRTWFIAAGLLGCILVAFAGYTLFQQLVATNEGTLVVELPEGLNSIPMKVTQSDGSTKTITVTQETDRLTLSLGRANLELEGATLESYDIDRQELQIRSGVNRVRIRRVAKSEDLSAKTDSKPDNKSPSITPTPRSSNNLNEKKSAEAVDQTMPRIPIDPAEIRQRPGLPKAVSTVVGSWQLQCSGGHDFPKLHPSGELLFANNLWSLRSGLPISDSLSCPATAVGFSHDGRWMFAENTVYRIERTESEEGWKATPTNLFPSDKYYDAACFSKDDRWMFAAVHNGSKIDIYSCSDQGFSLQNSEAFEKPHPVIRDMSLDHLDQLHVQFGKGAESILLSWKTRIEKSTATLHAPSKREGIWVFAEDNNRLAGITQSAPLHFFIGSSMEKPELELDESFNQVAISGDGTVVAAVSQHHVVYFWTLVNNVWQRSAPQSDHATIHHLRFDRNGKKLIAVDEFGAIDQYERTPSGFERIPIRSTQRIHRFFLSHDGKFLGTSGFTPSMIFNLSGGKPEGICSSLKGSDGVWLFAKDANWAWHQFDKKLYDLDSGKQYAVSEMALPANSTPIAWATHEDHRFILVYDISNNPDLRLKRIAWNISGNTLQLDDLPEASWKVVHGIDPELFSLESMRYLSRDGDGTIHIWQLKENHANAIDEFRLNGIAGNVHSANLSSSGMRVVAFNYSSDLTVWDLSKSVDGQPASHVLKAKSVGDASFSRDDQFVACAEGNQVVIYDSELQGKIGSVTLPVQIKKVRFSPDGNEVFTLNSDGTCYRISVKAQIEAGRKSLK